MKFSIVMPLYNGSQYLLETLESIYKLDYKNYELIIIDDGSSDKSSDIFYEYIKNFKINNFFYYKQRNQGPNVARNTGLKYCSGDYVIFLDSDDLLNSDCLNILNRELKDVFFDFLCFGFSFFDGESKKELSRKSYFREILVNEDINRESFSGTKISGISWNKCYNLNFLNSNNIRFTPDKLHGRDILFSRMCAIHAMKILIIPDLICFSRYHSNSFSRTFSERNITSAIDLCEKHYENFCGKIDSDLIFFAINKHINYIFIISSFRTLIYSDFIRFYGMLNLGKKELLKSGLYESDRKTILMDMLFNYPRLTWGLCKILKTIGYKPY
ncbi:glycosyltransferase family A protein [Photobacterium phosphoreum]|uniref:glycosyltransferase family A protein n=1 Tax=Photobacterium phosphoreum TaxID=659 RepID=UPI0039B0A4C1